MQLLVLSILLFNVYNLSADPTIRNNIQEDLEQSMFDLVTKYGYPAEIHVKIHTDDGYLLTMQRIRHGRHSTTNATNGKPILLMHGLFGGAELWLVNGPDHSLPFLLADAGYDVWLANARGTTNSRNHVTLNPDTDSEFWQFSWHEIGIYDLPAMVDYIREETETDKIVYLGHSQGTTVFFIMLSEKPKYNKYISGMVALAPVAFLSNINNPVYKYLAPFQSGFTVLAKVLNVNEILSNNELVTVATRMLCKEITAVTEICGNMVFLFFGYDSTQFNKTSFPLIMKYTPTGASMNQIMHYAQLINSGEFQKFDYGFYQNKQKYGTYHPPSYKMDRVKTKVAIFYAENDVVASQIDTAKLVKALPNVIYNYMVPYKPFNHMDFVYAVDVVPLVYNSVLKVIKDFS